MKPRLSLFNVDKRLRWHELILPWAFVGLAITAALAAGCYILIATGHVGGP